MPFHWPLHNDPESVLSEIIPAMPEPAEAVYRFSNPGITKGLDLDPQQLQAACHLNGPIRVLAPAGSGKTRTLAARINWMIQGGIPADKILALAFNNRAADEVGERVASGASAGVQVRTFHSLGYEILREGSAWRYRPGNEKSVLLLAEEIIRRHVHLPKHPGEARRLHARALKALIRAKSRLTPARELYVRYRDQTFRLERAFEEWVSTQLSAQLLTFQDMIYLTLCELITDRPLRDRWQNRFHFILVDEFQDLNPAQILLVRILALPQNNLFVVGDDDQLIYAWRDAEERHILELEAIYPGVRTFILRTNYRSDKKIVRHARWLIENNSNRVPKDIKPDSASGTGKLEIKLERDLENQARAAIDWIIALKNRCTLDWNDFGFLYRVHDDAEPLENALDEAGIPFVKGGPPAPSIGDPPPLPTPGRITLMTIHKSKGVEFPYVVYFNMAGGRSGPDVVDERRVAYVALTRAKHGVLVTSSPDTGSPFLAEWALNPGLSDYAESYLERQVTRLFRAKCFDGRNWRRWLKSFLPGAHLEPFPETDKPGVRGLEERLDMLATELSFRRLLGVKIKP